MQKIEAFFLIFCLETVHVLAIRSQEGKKDKANPTNWYNLGSVIFNTSKSQ